MPVVGSSPIIMEALTTTEKKSIEAIKKEYNLPENSINIVSREMGRVQISLIYQKDIDFLVTTYQRKFTYTAAGKDL